ncbi:MAG TPA: zf-HC2 domain-containing protein [Bacteroidota bacterium]|nr:zf-HC2 domain-containing protein [Bacteroidota bacterium]
MECDKFRSLLVDRQEGVISPADAELLERHLATCAQCTEDIASIGIAFDALRNVEDDAVPTHYFTNLLPNIRRRAEERRGPWPEIILPAWVQKFLAPVSAVAVVASMVSVYILCTPPAGFPSLQPNLRLEQLVEQVPRDDIDQITESIASSSVLARTMEPSQRMVETLSNPSLLSLHIEKELVDDELAHGHSLSIFLAADNSFEDIADEDVGPVIEQLNKISL